MKKHLAIVCGVFYPNPSPTGLCAKRFAELLSEQYDVDVVFLRSNDTAVEGIVVDGMRLYGLCGRRLAAEYRAMGAKKKLLHALGSLELKTRRCGNLSWFCTQATKKLEEINREHPLDAVLTVCSPLAAHLAGAAFKKNHPQTVHCAYTVDLYATKTRIRPLFQSYAAMRSMERRAMEAADCLLLSEEIYANEKSLYENVKQVRPLPYTMPEFADVTVEKRYFTDNAIHCVYAGSFYPQIRNPRTLLETFACLKNPKIMLDLFSSGCDELVRSYVDVNDNIHLHPLVAHSQMQRIYSEASILVGVGNNTAEFIPSKIFEYIASRKPIAFFHSAGAAAILEQYPCQWQACDEAAPDENTRTLEAFIVENHDTTVKTEDLTARYQNHTPANIARILRESLDCQQL